MNTAERGMDRTSPGGGEARPAGDLQAALEHAANLLKDNPALATEQALEILKVYPDSAAATHILATSYRLRGEAAEAVRAIKSLAEAHPESPHVLYELATCLAAAGQGSEAISRLRSLLRIDPAHAAAWRALGDQLGVAGDEQGSAQAYEMHLQLSTPHPELIEAADSLRTGNLANAERIARDVLKKDPADTVAIRMLAAIGIKLGHFDEAINLLKRCLELAPGFHLARQNYAVALSRRRRIDEALEQVRILLEQEPDNPNYLLLKGSFLVGKGDSQSALELYEQFLQKYPLQAGALMNYGHVLKTVGRVAESIVAYRSSLDLRPATGEAYWSLANLKTFRFTDADIDRMRDQVLDRGGDPDDQAHLLFALGKALEDHGHFDESFEYYSRGNSIRSKHHRHNARVNIFNTARQIKTLDANFFRSRHGYGCPAPDPIFIVGLPRAGSTLVEQILASHSQVEGTAELPDIIAISRQLGKKSRKNPASLYPELLTQLPADRCQALGESYLASTSIHRHGPPFFIDKLPNNFQHIGLIHLILPNARIIDARRHPMACCFSCYKQLFARGQTFTYDLTHLGHYYRDYVTLMDHWDAVLPGRVHRVQYERMVEDTEGEIRRLLDYCGLGFEESCLRFFETERAIRTPSAEQVRQPVYREGLEHWRHYEKHLEPLKAALGPVLERYPA